MQIEWSEEEVLKLGGVGQEAEVEVAGAAVQGESMAESEPRQGHEEGVRSGAGDRLRRDAR